MDGHYWVGSTASKLEGKEQSYSFIQIDIIHPRGSFDQAQAYTPLREAPSAKTDKFSDNFKWGEGGEGIHFPLKKSYSKFSDSFGVWKYCKSWTFFKPLNTFKTER